MLSPVVIFLACGMRAPQEPLYPVNETALLWRVTGNDLQDTSYLLGTMHNVGGDFVNTIPGFRKAFLKAKQVAIERDLLSETPKPRRKNNAMNGWRMPADTTYEQLYTDVHQFQTVDSVLKMRFSTYKHMKPAFWAKLLNVMIQYSDVNYGDGGMDKYILLLGYQNSRTVFFMETNDEVSDRTASLDSIRLTIVNGVPLSQQADALFHLINAEGSLRAYYDSIKTSYKRDGFACLIRMGSDESEMQSELNSSTSIKLKEINRRLGSDRNEKWMSNILPNIRKASSLIAVGGMHLVGEDGLIAKLRSLGYKVEPVTE